MNTMRTRKIKARASMQVQGDNSIIIIESFVRNDSVACVIRCALLLYAIPVHTVRRRQVV